MMLFFITVIVVIDQCIAKFLPVKVGVHRFHWATSLFDLT